ncbi:MAG: glutamine-hydrolyzing carbamoyl-phosphate synthase small subunit [Clostridia bacterium]|nr:glutamine-hydrolyzing carbamoyl-phosphate synthase small subunit [Clostridia bacterium]MBQ8523269.1 glutamine-hydrolyzing carbamoyl-phosphate synthase small subunit [Clostridia bacterium]
MKKAYLILDGGRVFEGYSFGAETSALGQLVFNTSVVGYLEAITEPAYKGQILLQTFPLIGNYGVIPSDLGDECTISGYVVREWCDNPSNFRCEGDLDTYLRSAGVPGIWGVDTRELTRLIRENGEMNAMIAPEIPEDVSVIATYKAVDAVKSVSVKEKKVYAAEGEKKYSVTLVDYGTRPAVIADLTKLGCEVTVVPYNTKAEDILAGAPDAVVLSEGPGDPKDNPECVEEIKKLMGKTVIFGIGLGHQMLALANGCDTFKMGHGHRGGNQPVSELFGTHTWITTQNHSYAVDPATVKAPAVVTMENTNDKTCEGIEYEGLKAFSVQFCPETAWVPLTPNALYEKLMNLMDKEN